MSKSIHLFFFIIIIYFPALAQKTSDIQLANQYYQDGQIEKAISMYESLAKNSRNIPLIHNNYYRILLNTGRFDEAEDYILKVLKKYPGNPYYQIDRGLIFVQKNQKEKEKAYFTQLIEEMVDEEFQIRVAAQHFARNQLYEYALQVYALSRKKQRDPYMYSLQMANLYRILNRKDQMIEEYLNFTNEQPNQINSVKNILQNVLTEEEDLTAFENMMIDKVQKNPNNDTYTELLIWVNLQQKDFYAAFIQARAVDKRFKLQGSGVLNIGKIALENKDYRNAIRIFEYIIDNYPETQNYQVSRRYVIKAREEKVKNTFPVDKEEIRILISDYNELIDEIGLNQYTVEAMRSKALLHAFYLDEYQQAIKILEEIINIPRMNKRIVDRSKLDLGDIYLLIDQPWESTLLYSQVEKSSKETPIGYEAKYKNAILSYYTSDFALAQAHLDILKNATTREIANDALKLSLLIKDNTALDTTDENMKRYAYVDLLLFQNKKMIALDSIGNMKKDLKMHSLYDEILLLEANINLELGNFDNSISILNELIENYHYDILGDDALYLKGKILQDYKKQDQQAIEIYKEILIKYPGSIYVADARRRLRILRGDFVN